MTQPAGPSILPVVALAFGGGIVVETIVVPAAVALRPSGRGDPDALISTRRSAWTTAGAGSRQVRPVGAALAIIGAILFIAGVTIVAFVQPIAVLLFVLPALCSCSATPARTGR